MWKHCLLYLEDIIFLSKHGEKPISDVDEFLQVFLCAYMKLNAENCTLSTKSVEYMSQVIRKETIKVATLPTRSLGESEHPENKSEVSSFLDLRNVHVPGLHDQVHDY